MKNFLTIMMSVFLILSGCAETTAEDSDENRLLIHFIDVGQGDCTFLQLPNGENMLIDAGNPENAEQIAQYLEDNGCERLNYVIATHPHSDHIGAMADILSEFGADEIYLPDVSHTSFAFEEMLNAIDENGISAKAARAGVRILNEGTLKAELIAPVRDDYSELNNFSAVLRLTYGKTSFLFMGDAEKSAERDILASGADVHADVLKCGHHGGNTCSGEDFIKSVNPQCAVISCGTDNSYGHPHSEVLSLFETMKIPVCRTDRDGTVVASSDGNKVEIHTSSNPESGKADEISIKDKNEANEREPEKNSGNDIVYITKTGKCYHRENCTALSKSSIAVALTEAESKGLLPCSICKP